MTTPVVDDRRSGERRGPVDRRAVRLRRSAVERRNGERRAALRPVEQERRTGRDRRQDQRRELFDRRGAEDRRAVVPPRRQTPSPYTAEEVECVRAMFAAPGERPLCPVCRGTFALGPSRPRGPDAVRRVQCQRCGKGAAVTNSWVARVMVVDNAELIRASLRAIFTEAGHDVVEATDAAAALAACADGPADVVFVNVHVTGHMDAAGFIRRLRRESPEVKIVAISGRSSYGGARDPLALATRLGAARAIRLPITREGLLRALDEARRESVA